MTDSKFEKAQEEIANILEKFDLFLDSNWKHKLVLADDDGVEFIMEDERIA